MIYKEFYLSDFKETLFPEKGSKAWLKLPNKNKEFFIEKKGEIKITRYKGCKETTFEFNNLTLRYTYIGEFGGHIEILNNLTKHKEVIEETQIKYVFSFKDSYYFIRSLDHMGYSIGEVYEFFYNNENNEFSYKKKIDLKKSCDAYTIENNKLYLLLEDEIVEMKKNKNLEIKSICKGIPFDILYSNSLIKIDNIFYIGMRSGLGKINIENKKIDYLTLRKNHNP